MDDTNFSDQGFSYSFSLAKSLPAEGGGISSTQKLAQTQTMSSYCTVQALKATGKIQKYIREVSTTTQPDMVSEET